MKIICIVLLVALISGIIGAMSTDVGEAFPAGVYSVGLPFVGFLLMAIPALLGYLIGKE